MKQKIAITSLASISPLGDTATDVWHQYCNSETTIVKRDFNGIAHFVAEIPSKLRNQFEVLRLEDPKYRGLDETVLMAISVTRKVIQERNWKSGDDFGINIGSSRGATQLTEKFHKEFLETGSTPTLTSPTTTLGNIASWVAHDSKSSGVVISHSITCSTSLHAILNAIAWLQSGMASKFIAGGSEAPLTTFTLAQMQALKIYAREFSPYPCRAFDLEKKANSMVLGEGAAVVALEIGEQLDALAYIVGIGYATDTLEHNISISEEAECFQKSMKMALGTFSPEEVDAIVMHAPGTIKGDRSEVKAIEKVFGNSKPLLTTNKWKIGHTFGASGVLSLELALFMLRNNRFIGVPFAENQIQKKDLKKIMINAVGFGGNAVSILISVD